MLKRSLVTVGVLLAVFCLFVALQPSDYVIAREVSIQKPAEVIFPYLNNAKLMAQWAPWPEIDPKVVMAYSGPEAGVGAKSSWDSQGQMGAGTATVIESIPNQLVRTKLEYTRPFAMIQEAELSIRTQEAQSIVRWSVKGTNGFSGKLFGVLMNMDKMVGGNFDSGLMKLKTIAER